MPEGRHNSLAGAEPDKLPRCGSYRRHGLQCGILPQTAEDYCAHFIPQAIEPAQLIEHALAPEKRIGIVWKPTAEWTQVQWHLTTMILQIAIDDPVLQQPAK